MRNKLFLSTLGLTLFLSSFIAKPLDDKQPKTITKSTILVDGEKIEKTVILLNASTSREDLIHTCSFLAQEDVQLTFDKLTAWTKKQEN